MANTLTHSPAEIIRQLLIDLGEAVVGSYSANAYTGSAWPCFAPSLVDLPDNCIAVRNSAGIDFGSSQIDGSLYGNNGFQITVRGTTHRVGWAKADAIQTALAQSVLRKVVHVESSNYLIQCIAGIGDVLDLGTESPSSKRHLFTINAVAPIRKL